MALPSGTDVEFVGASASGGTTLGQTSTELISFYAATPIAQPSGSTQAAVVTDAATTGSATYGFTSAQANSIVALLNIHNVALIVINQRRIKAAVIQVSDNLFLELISLLK